MKRSVRLVVLVAVVAAAITVYLERRHRLSPPEVSQLAVTAGNVIEAATATGTLTATRTVDIGSQVSGMVTHLYADFNSLVHAKEVLAELDPAQSRAALDSAKASLDRADIDLETEEDFLKEDQLNFQRTETLFERDMVAAADLDLAKVQVDEDSAQIRQDEASIKLANAEIAQAQTNLDQCTIVSPIDGVVISRNVDEGQAVAATMSAPTLYVLGTDLTHLTLTGNVDEADVGRIRIGQTVSFTVDAYPSAIFRGAVTIVRLDGATVNGVVTYPVVVAVDNPDLRLRPGMTANLTVETARAVGVVRVPNLALRFRPTPQLLAALHEPEPPSLPAPPATTSPTPEASGTTQPAPSTAPTRQDKVDRLFARTARAPKDGQVWIWQNSRLERVPVRLGITDGTWTEVVAGQLQSGEQVVTNVYIPVRPAR